jgi:soluble lytic murein transglycosylase-like protein
VLQALAQQRIYGTLALHPRLYSQVLPLLSPDLRVQARANATAGADLISLVAPSSHHVTFRTRAPLPAAVLLGYYMRAQRRFGVPWQLLAAVNNVESRFGRVISASSAGAQGPMQFIPTTWDAYGLGGDIHDPADAIMGAANYLHASGSPDDDAGALFHYNPASAYVDAVMRYTREMTRDPRSFYAYYNWQVFVLTPSGFRQLTGPGS